MASTPIEFRYFSALTLTADLTAADDSIPNMLDGVTPATGLTATENTNGKGRYKVTYTGTATGHHVLTIKSGTDVVLTADYSLEDTTDIHFPMQADAASNGGFGTNIATEITVT